MAEGGTESLRNNLCRNQKDKVVETKDVQPRSGFPELAFADRILSSAPLGLHNGGFNPTITPVHQYSRQNETEYKDILDKAPLLTPIASELNIREKEDQLSRSDPSKKISNIDTVASDTAAEDQSLPAGAGKAGGAEGAECGSDDGGLSFTSSYLRVGVVSASLETASPSFASHPSSSSYPVPEGQKVNTNDLSAPRYGPTTFPAMMGPGYGNFMGGMMPVLYYPMMPMSCDSAGQPPVMNAMFASQPVFPMSHSVGPTPLVMPQNIACGAPGLNGGVSGAMGGQGLTGGSPLMAMMGGCSSQQTLDSRNIPVNGVGGAAASSSTENSAEGSRSCSINPGKGTRLIRLRDPVLQWIRKKLESHGYNNWEAVADIHGWNYEEIREHLTDCRHNRDSPFLKMLESKTFCAYTVQNFCDDMQRIGRKDILMDFDEVLQNNRP